MNFTKYFIITLSLFLMSITVNAQWILQSSGTNQNLYDVEFINEYTGWALGDAGIIVKTTDGGENWLNVPNPSINGGGILWSVFPVDSNIVYIAGGHNVLLKTTDGGNSWIEIRNGPWGIGNSNVGIYFMNQDTGWICGHNRVIRTTDGGLTFDSTYVPFINMMDIYFKDYNTGLICQEARVLKTTNSGAEWFNTNVPTSGVISFFRKFAIAEDQYVWVGGNNGVLYKSSDFAETWEIADTISGGAISGIDFINANTGFTGGSFNKLFKTTDGGYTWLQEETPQWVVAFIASIRFINDSVGWVVGGAGRIMNTITGGQTMVNITNYNESLPENYSLYQNFPNPFNPTTTISFDIPQTALVELTVYDALGREIVTLVNETLTAGSYNYQWTIENAQLGSGIYFYRLNAGEFSETKRFVILK